MITDIPDAIIDSARRHAAIEAFVCSKPAGTAVCRDGKGYRLFSAEAWKRPRGEPLLPWHPPQFVPVAIVDADGNVTRPPTAIDDARACALHYLDEILEYIEDTGDAPATLDKYTCGADYQHDAGIVPELFACIVGRINSLAKYGLRGAELREVLTLALESFREVAA